MNWWGKWAGWIVTVGMLGAAVLAAAGLLVLAGKFFWWAVRL